MRLPNTACRLRSTRRGTRSLGFTLPEILIAMLILGVVAAGFTRLIVSQTRFYDTQTGLRNARTISRNSMNILLSDLRMVQEPDGVEAAAADGKSMTVIVPYRFGLVCGVSGGVTTVMMLPTDSSTLAMSHYAGYSWRNPATGRYTSIPASGPFVNSATPTRCTGTGAGEAQIRYVTVQGRTGAAIDLQPDAPGAVAANPVFFWQRVTYSFAASTAYPGKIGLWRAVENGRTDELIAPFDTSARFRYYTAGTDVAVTTPPPVDQIRGVELVLTSEAPRKAAGQTAPSMSRTVTSVFFKNVRTF